MAVSYIDAGLVEYPSGGTSSTFTLSLAPAGFQVGDVLVVSISCASGGATSLTPPSGAIEVFGPASGPAGVNGGVYLYAIGDPKPASVTWTWAGAERGTLAWVQLRGAKVSAMLDVAGIGAWSGDYVTSWSAPGMTTASDGSYLVGGLIIGSGSSTITPPAGWTLRTDAAQREGTIFTKGLAATAGAQAGFSVSGPSVYGRAWQLAVRDAAAVAPPQQSNLILGIPTPSTLGASVRTADTTSVRLKVGTDDAVTAGVVWGAAVTPDGAGWAKVTSGAIAPDTDYWCRVELTGSSTELGPVVGPIRTAPTPGTPTSFAFMVGGDIEEGSDAGETWASMAQHLDGARFFLGTGDMHPYDNTSSSQASHRADWESALASFPTLRNALGNLPSAMGFSDHDAGGGNNSAPGVWTAPNVAAYQQVWPYPTSPMLPRNCGASFVWGRVRVIILDDYHERTATYKVSPEQMAWLEGELAEPEALKVVVQSGTWPDFEPAEGFPGGDGWTEVPANVAALTALFEGAVGQVYMLHGDAHTLSADDGSNNPWGGFPTSDGAAIAAASSHKGDNIYSQGVYPTGTGVEVHQHGYVTIDDDGTDVRVAFTGYDTVPRIALSFGGTAPAAVPGTSTASLTGPANRWQGKITRPLWHDGSLWRAILPTPSGHYLWVLSQAGSVQGPLVDSRQSVRVDVVHHAGTTYALRAHATDTFLSVYNAALAPVRAAVRVPLTTASHDASPITLHRAANGHLWASVAAGGVVRVSRSTDDGQTWSAATTIFTMTSTTGLVKLVDVGTDVLAVISENDGGGRIALRIAQAAGAITSGAWTSEVLPAGGAVSDDHLSVVSVGGVVWVATKTSDPATVGVPLIQSLTRDVGGTWTQATVEDGPDVTGLSFTRPAITVLPDGTALAVYGSNTIYPPHLYGRRFEGGVWGDRFVLIPGGTTGYPDSGVIPYPEHVTSGAPGPFPILARNDESGTITLAWHQAPAGDPGAPSELAMYLGDVPIIAAYLGDVPITAVHIG